MRVTADAHSAPLRGLAVLYSSAVAINQSKRLRAKDHLSEAPSEEGAPPQAVREFPFQRQSYFPVNAATRRIPPTSLCGYTATLKAYANHSPRGRRGEQAKTSQRDVFTMRRSQSKKLYERIIREIKRLCDATEGRGRGVAGRIPPRLPTKHHLTAALFRRRGWH